MKVRKMVIGIRSAREWASEVKRGLKRGVSGQRLAARETVHFESAAAVRNFFSDRRLELLRAIREYRPRSIKQLAELVGRDLKNVNDEVHYLTRLGLVELEAEHGVASKGRKAPRVVCDELELRIPL
jgi:predicted transcriptional regulator